MQFNLFNGDCLDVLKTLPDNSVDSIVTDPPYGLSNQSQDDIVKCLTAWLADETYTHGKAGFMGKKWDSFVPSPTVWKECLRVLKHGGHIACFAGSRTQDLMGMSLRLAGFEMRDVVMWVYGSGFPKGLDIAKGIDKELGLTPIEIGANKWDGRKPNGGLNKVFGDYKGNDSTIKETIGNSQEAKQWEGWNTNLKPAYEPIILARKPLDGTVVNNVLKHGVGGLNIGACRVETDETVGGRGGKKDTDGANCYSVYKGDGYEPRRHTQGRYPANLIHDGSEEATGGMPWTKSPKGMSHRGASKNNCMSGANTERYSFNGHNDQGSASRYFYCAKASKADRDEGLEGFELQEAQATAWSGEGMPLRQDGTERKMPLVKNLHPTVKPTSLMQYVTKLITPPNGTVLDPFMGSGSTGKACMLEGFNFTGIELSEEYLAIAEARIKHAQSLASRKQLKLDV
jgi:site-specific DNA-methyltransferase (adenine-specific)